MRDLPPPPAPGAPVSPPPGVDTRDPGDRRGEADPGDRRGEGEDGNALVLMPIGVLVVLLLAGLAVDTALLYRAQAELDSVAAGLANDVAEAVDTASLFDDDRDVRIDPRRLAAVVALHEGASGVAGTDCEAFVTVGPEPVATATCRGDAEAIFRTVAGLDNIVSMSTTESADLRTD